MATSNEERKEVNYAVTGCGPVPFVLARQYVYKVSMGPNASLVQYNLCKVERDDWQHINCAVMILPTKKKGKP